MPDTLASLIRSKYPGAYDDMSDRELESSVKAKYPGAYDDLPTSEKTAQGLPASTPTAEPTPEPSALSRFASNFAQRALPSTKPSDYIEGPLYAMQHPIDSLSLLFGAVKDAHVAQAGKTSEAAGRVFSAPTLGGKLGAVSEAVGHGAATVLPFVGPVAADIGEQLGGGDVAGASGGLAGLLAPSGAAAVAGKTKSVLSGRLAAGNDTRMNQALAATTKENKARSARVAPEMVKRGIWNKDLPTLEARAAEMSEKAGQDVKAAVANVANKDTDVLPLVEALEDAKASAVDTNAAGQRVVIEPDQVKAIETLQSTLMEYGDTISIGSLNKVRLKWDEVVQSAKGFTSPDVGWKAWAAREGRSALREELGKASPDIDAVMHEYSFWQNVEDVAHATNQRRVGQVGGLRSTIAGGAGLIAGELLAPGSGIAGKLGGAALGASLVSKLKRLFDSPGWKMWSAVQRQHLADALASGNTSAIEAAIAKGGSAASSVEPMPSRAFPVGAR